MGKTCFVISPIGDDESQTRRQSDCVFEYIIIPALGGLGYDHPIRIDMDDKPAHITTEIIKNLVHADLVIADLSAVNANVFYELGIRHAYQKPCILISDWVVRPPFDVSGINVIKYVYDDPKSNKQTSNRISEQIKSFEGSSDVSSPVTIALGFERLSEAGDDISKLVSTLAEQVERLQHQFDRERTEALKRPVSNKNHTYTLQSLRNLEITRYEQDRDREKNQFNQLIMDIENKKKNEGNGTD